MTDLFFHSQAVLPLHSLTLFYLKPHSFPHQFASHNRIAEIVSLWWSASNAVLNTPLANTDPPVTLNGILTFEPFLIFEPAIAAGRDSQSGLFRDNEGVRRDRSNVMECDRGRFAGRLSFEFINWCD